MGGVQSAPPRPCLFGDEVGEDGVARPHLADVDVAALGLAHHVLLDGLVEHPVAGVVLHAGIDDRDHSEALLCQPRQHAGRIGEGFGVPGEDAVPVHVFDVQPQRVARDGTIAMLGSKLFDRILRVLGPAALVITQ